MASCDRTSPESYPGKGDGGYSCGKPGMSECCVCNGEYCNRHIVFCEDCNSWMCGSCAPDHVCKKLPRPEGKGVIQDCLDAVDRVAG
jgi:hypothetical protein